MGKKIAVRFIAVATLFFGIFLLHNNVQAQSGGFAIQVTPSPLVENIEAGVTKTVEVKIRNQNTEKETYKIALRSFTVDGKTGDVTIGTSEPAEVKDWVVFSDPIFAVDPGEWFTQKVTFNVPQNVGFSYSFALMISRAEQAPQVPGKTAIEGSVAVFTLLSTNRQDATRKVDIASFTSKKKVYDYLPTSFNLELKNSGNTIVQPAGNIYIQRNATSTTPLAVLPVNATAAYLLPNVTRTLTAEWKDGFPYYESKPDSDKRSLKWDWSKLQNFRFGHYVAKVVVIYNNGQSDIPVEAIVDFWVIPWKLLLIVLLFVVFMIVGIVTVVRKSIRFGKKKKQQKSAHESPAKES